ncbi:hypothetical protein K504DRAFT_526003 [Pleomassaria siparia CBS 279.74]|uniref:Uncharacterized protein n=1 Tax=Pleomassaria siparia CBS 279.74 TaxID=1314801 RepID=A0A6G1KA19_9PLEO|nr:hypothetical protein K504DRAFT_526003 [Pleomassaria siparia CBS 279.74]
MERVFPIRCTILDDSPHLDGDNLRQGSQSQSPPCPFIASHIVCQIDIVTSNTPRPSPSTSGSDSSTSTKTPSDERQQPSHDFVDDTVDPRSPDETLANNESGEYAFADDKGHGVITGKRARFTRCEDEQIQIPGSIQAHGMLVGLEMIGDVELRYSCCIVSDNSESICGYSPRVLLALSDFHSILSPPYHSIFDTSAAESRNQFIDTHKSHEPKVFSIMLQNPQGHTIPLWCASHFVGGSHNLLICEFELQKASSFETPYSDLPSTPFCSLGNKPKDTASSFTDKSEPMNLHTKTLFRGEGSAMQLLDVVSQVQGQLSSQTTIEGLLDVIVDEEYNGKVVAELVDARASSDIFKGLHFPNTDIPPQARRLYKINRVRVLFDREQEPCRLICRTAANLDTPLDLTHSYLRAMSPVHLKYLKNMNVRSTMSISLDYRGNLWGLICCHSYGPTGRKTPFPIRELTYWLGLCASDCLYKLLNAERIQARKLVSAMQLNFKPIVWLSASSTELLRLFRANFGFLVVRGEARTIGRLSSSYLEAVTLLKYVYFRKFENTFASKNITKDFSDLHIVGGFDHIAGILVVPLSPAIGDFIIFFRASQTKEVDWAGNPKKFGDEKKLEPRNSFKKWTETVRGTCQEWTEEELEAAGMTRLVYGNFIRVWREKEADLQESRMKRVLLFNLSHELRTPLNAVVNYLEIALEERLDRSTKAILASSHTAAKSLIYVIEDLLNLTVGTKQPTPLAHVAFDLRKGLQSILDHLQFHANQKLLNFDVITDIDFPRFVFGDLQRLQQAVSSLVTNSIQYTTQGSIVVHLGVSANESERCIIKISVQDSGIGMSQSELDDIFREFEQVSDEDDLDQASTEKVSAHIPKAPEKGSKLGLGLALLSRYIKHSGAQVRGRSSPGKGSTFSLEIPLQLATEEAVDTLPFSSQTMSATNGRSGINTGSSGIISPTSPEQSAGYPGISSLAWMKFRSSPTLSASSHLEPATAKTAEDNEAHMRDNNLTVLLADDNPVNLAVLERRLKKSGHKVHLSRDGQQCFDVFRRSRDQLGFILMDINMPMVDGIMSTTMIRALEAIGDDHDVWLSAFLDSSPTKRRNRPSTLLRPASSPPPNLDAATGSTESLPCTMEAATTPLESDPSHICRPTLTSSNLLQLPGEMFSQSRQVSSRPSSMMTLARHTDHLPIFAISSALYQHTQESLQEAGFDGWLSKPVDFQRLSLILKGATDEESRLKGIYRTDDVKAGGWFH